MIQSICSLGISETRLVSVFIFSIPLCFLLLTVHTRSYSKNYISGLFLRKFGLFFLVESKKRLFNSWRKPFPATPRYLWYRPSVRSPFFHLMQFISIVIPSSYRRVHLFAHAFICFSSCHSVLVIDLQASLLMYKFDRNCQKRHCSPLATFSWSHDSSDGESRRRKVVW